MTVKVWQKLRNGNNFNLFWENVTAKAKSFEVDEPKLPRKGGAQKKFKGFYGFEPTKPAHPDESKDFYLKHYYEAPNHVINCIKERFNQEDFQKYALLQEVLLKAARKQPFNVELEEVYSSTKVIFWCISTETSIVSIWRGHYEITDFSALRRAKKYDGSAFK